ncbi:MAG TPA: NAD+ synthase [Candidatus Aminicenantes bacterium]|nr:NAD+ synthase [Candidatus Aminicenantes bacterium]
MNEIDSATVTAVLTRFIADAVAKTGHRGAILGVSGGLDSAVVLALAARALGPAGVTALLLPYRMSAPESARHGRNLCQQLGVECHEIDISPQIDAYFARFPAEPRMLLGNKCARERMSILYDHSVRRQALVIGTSNKSELLVGYSTLFGDSAAAIQPIGDLYKTQVFSLALHLGIPAEIIAKQPSADLWPGQTDEGELGITYRELDEILFQLVDRRLSPAQVVALLDLPAERVARVRQRIVRSQYKRTMPPVAKLSNRTVGLDFRYLRDLAR